MQGAPSFMYSARSMRSMMSMGGEEDFTGREVPCMGPDGTQVSIALLLEQIACAGFSQVYKCVMAGGPLDGQLAAAKVLTTGQAGTVARAEPLLKRLYDRETNSLRAVRHPHVIELLGTGEVRPLVLDMESCSPQMSFVSGMGNRKSHLGENVLGSAAATPGSADIPAADALNPATPGSLGPPSQSHNTLESAHASFQSVQSVVDQALGTAPSGATDVAWNADSLDSATQETPPQHPLGLIEGRSSLPAQLLRAGSAGGQSAEVPSTPRARGTGAARRASGVEFVDGTCHSFLQTPDRGNMPGSFLFARSQLRQAGSFVGWRPPFLRGVNSSMTSMRCAGGASMSGTGPPRRVLFLQWMPGGDARSLVDHAMRPMEEEAVATIILPIAQALAAAHAAGIVHRDVKAGNILLAPGPRQVRLADWGISVSEAESSSRMSNNGTIARAPGAVGTEFWCAPEIEMGLAHDRKSDVFSLAITFIELVTGRDPKYDNTMDGFQRLAEPDAGLLPAEDEVSQMALEWLVPCLALDPAKRPSIPDLLQHPYFVSTLARMELEEQEMEMELEMQGSAAFQLANDEAGLLSADDPAGNGARTGVSLFEPVQPLVPGPLVKRGAADGLGGGGDMGSPRAKRPLAVVAAAAQQDGGKAAGRPPAERERQPPLCGCAIC